MCLFFNWFKVDLLFQTGTSNADNLRNEVERLKTEQAQTLKLVTQLTARCEDLEARLSAIEGKTSSAPAQAKTVNKFVHLGGFS